jgi:hypothetical protein
MKLTIGQFADSINKMAWQGNLWACAGTIKETKDLWRCPSNMDLLCPEARDAARHYIREANGEK